MTNDDRTTTCAIVWRRLDRPGHDAVRLVELDGGWRLQGAAVFRHEGRPCALTYRVECDAAWRTLAGEVRGWAGEEEVQVEFRTDTTRRWWLNGVECSAVAGCWDVDYGFTPATNTLPIRRLRPAVGERALVRAAWLRFPELRLEPLEQVYRRTGDAAYVYESGNGRFRAALAVDTDGLVTEYAGFWAAERE